MTRLMSALASFGAITGAASLALYFSTIPLRSLLEGRELPIIFDRLSLQIWFLECILIITALVLAILGVVGYQSIKDEATKQAVEAATKRAVEKAQSDVSDFLKSSSGSERIPGLGGKTADPSQVQKEKSDA